MNNTLFVVLSSLLSGLIGVVITNWLHYRNERRRIKLNVLQQLLGNRYDLRSELFSQAINSIFVVFSDSKEVITALKVFHEEATRAHKTAEVSNQKFIDLLKAMCFDLGIDPKPLTDNFFIQPFNIAFPNRGTSPIGSEKLGARKKWNQAIHLHHLTTSRPALRVLGLRRREC